MQKIPIFLDPNRIEFPDVNLALEEPNGLLAIGGDLSPERLMAAYREGIFPWYNEGQPILWWSPNPRAVFFPEKIKISRSLAKEIRQEKFSVTYDQDFAGVIAACAGERPGQTGTWITEEMRQAYIRLHELGIAHSVEIWREEKLIGGAYGVSLGKIFFAESMFYREPNASKIALVFLAKKLIASDYQLIDCQMMTQHLLSLGAENLPREKFIELLKRWRDAESAFHS